MPSFSHPPSGTHREEPGTSSQIKTFAKSYNAQFDMFSKIDVNGANAHPLWKWLKDQANGKGFLGNRIKWNFTKFLINRKGQVMKRYSPWSDPSDVEKDLPNKLMAIVLYFADETPTNNSQLVRDPSPPLDSITSALADGVTVLGLMSLSLFVLSIRLLRRSSPSALPVIRNPSFK